MSERQHRITPLWVGGPRHGQVVTVETDASLPDYKLPLPSVDPVRRDYDGPPPVEVVFVLYRHGMLRMERSDAAGIPWRWECRIAYAVYGRWSEVELLDAWNVVAMLVWLWRGWPGLDEGERWIVHRGPS